MDYQRNGDLWRRGYPADTPGLDICWQNFASCAELMLRQAARLQPVRWRETMRELCRRTSGRETGWWLVNELAEAADNRQLSRVVGRCGRLDLLLLDELGYVQLEPRGAELLFQIITEREERASIAIGTNLPFSEGEPRSPTPASSPPS